jgi:hypothetical protein
LNGTTWTDASTGGTSSSFTISGLTSGFKYFIKIKVTNANGYSDWSSVSSAYTVASGVAVPNSWALLAAGSRSAVLGTETGSNVTSLNNGTYFYNNPSASIGFSPTSTISQNSADTADSSLVSVNCSTSATGNTRLSWHRSGGTNGTINGGWRYGCNTGLNADNTAVRAIYQSNNLPSYYPSGPQSNIIESALIDGCWESCYLAGYGPSVAFSMVSSA